MNDPYITRALVGAELAERQGVDGSDWYPNMGRVARRLANAHGTTWRRALYAIARTSPRTRWGENVKAAEWVLAGNDPQSCPHCFHANAQRAADVVFDASRQPQAELGAGLKVNAFYRNGGGDADHVTCDAWHCRFMGADERTVANQSAAGRRAYAELADATRAAARILSVRPCDLQATLWILVRGSAA